LEIQVNRPYFYIQMFFLDKISGVSGYDDITVQVHYITLNLEKYSEKY